MLRQDNADNLIGGDSCTQIILFLYAVPQFGKTLGVIVYVPYCSL